MEGNRNIILYIATSLDGYIARENGDVDWLFTDQDYGYSEFIRTVDTVLMGMKTYEQVLTFEEFPYKDKECFVFTSNPEANHDSNVTFINQDVQAFVERIKKGKGRDIWLVGGSQLIAEFVKLNLIDQYIISIHPVLLGNGIALFRSGFKQIDLVLKNAERFDSGLVQVSYIRHN